ncbi:MAG: inositol monophosphatase [Anaerolineae bacterium]|nr:inositol monophosphatase [Anaerolineae bacterium]
MDLNLQEIRRIAEEIALNTAPVLMDYYQKPLQYTSKTSKVDIVTEADKASEARIVALLQQHFPDHHIVGEEGGGMGAPAETARYFWYVDPLDGTVNFANHIPMFSISLALTDRERRPLVGVVYHPVAHELYSGAIGHGATLNDTPLRVSQATELINSVVASGFPYSKAIDPDNNIREWGEFVTRTRGTRRMGSAALDMCYVAAGRYDGYWEQKLHPWDYLAGAVCVQEAGGQVTDYTGKDDPSIYQHGRIVASNGHIHDEMIALLASTAS